MVRVRAMIDQDVDQVSDLLCACYRWLGEREHHSSEATEYLVRERGAAATVRSESRDQRYLVACRGPDVVGVVSFRGGEITKLYVKPECHRQGVGSLLFREAEHLISERGIRELTLVAIGRSPLPFYESMGMSVVRCLRADIAELRGLTALQLRKVLDPGRV